MEAYGHVAYVYNGVDLGRGVSRLPGPPPPSKKYRPIQNVHPLPNPPQEEF